MLATIRADSLTCDVLTDSSLRNATPSETMRAVRANSSLSDDPVRWEI